MQIPIKRREDVNLAQHHSFALNAYAREVVFLEDPSQLNPDSLLELFKGRPYWLLGEGSNTLFLENLEAMIIKILLKGMSVTHETKEFIWVSGAAGESWDAFVSFTLDQGGFGLENLSLIPGTLGAAPIQNIGAYGIEVSHYIDSVVCYDLIEHQYLTLPASACGFGYRESHFKTLWKGRYLITQVVFRLPKLPQIQLDYPDLKRFFESKDRSLTGSDLTPNEVRAAVIDIRKNKLPDPRKLANAGSFFKNPIVPLEAYQRLKIRYPEIKGYPLAENKIKIPAGWLIEYLGFKGQSSDNFGCYAKHSLILVNHQKNLALNDGANLLVYVKHMTDVVFTHFGLLLEVEPVLVDNHLITVTNGS